MIEDADDPPRLAPSRRETRERAAAAARERRIAATFLALAVAPLAGGVAGALMFVRETLGPFVTGVVWLALLIRIATRNARAVQRGERYVSWLELVPVVGCLIILQLLLDLHTPHLGDLVIAAIHAPFLALGLVHTWRERRARPPPP